VSLPLSSICAVVGVAILLFPSLAGARDGAGTADSGPRPEQVERWVRELNDDSFIRREIATTKLIEAGVDSIAPLVTALSENNLEVTTRAIHILRELALSNDPELEKAAHQTLLETARPGGTSAARRARATLETLDVIRQERAVAELKQLGAIVVQTQLQPVFGQADLYSIEIGEAWRGQAADLSRLQRIKNLGQLVFEGPRVTDAWLQQLPTPDGPWTLIIKRANITDAGSKHLAALRGLELLSLMYLPITNQSVPHLQQMATVSTMKLYGTRISPDAAEDLQAALRGTEVDYRRGAFLGIGCQPGENGCVIYTIQANTAADRGGLQTNDVIYEYEGTKVTDFEQLTGLIAQNEAGDTVSIKVLRRGQPLEKRVTLGEWQ
jgi:hypothetical protein